MAGILELMGFSPASSETESDIILINTCAIRENAKIEFGVSLEDLRLLREIIPI